MTEYAGLPDDESPNALLDTVLENLRALIRGCDRFGQHCRDGSEGPGGCRDHDQVRCAQDADCRPEGQGHDGSGDRQVEL